MDVLFVDLPFNSYELGRSFKAAWSFKAFIHPHEVHLGYRYMVAALRARGRSADVVYPSPSTDIVDRAQLARRVAELAPRVVGFTSYEGSLQESLQFIRSLRRLGVRSLVVVGGHLATFSYREIAARANGLVDAIVLGEGEDAICEIVDALDNGRELDAVPGLALPRRDGVITTPPRPLRTDIDALPFPVLPPPSLRRATNTPLFLISSRGCYGRCSFCRSSHFGERWRHRDPGQVVDEIEAACAAGIRLFEFVDDNFLGPGQKGRRRAEAIADEIRRRGLDIRFHLSCRVNDVTESTMRRLQQAGLFSVSLGVESGVQRQLDDFHKDVTVQQNLEALELLDRMGLAVLAYVIFFDPYTTLDEAAENLAFLERVRALPNVRFEAVLFRKLIPISGTELFDRLRADGLLRGDCIGGHRFVFRDPRVGVLADFLERVDLRFERLLQDPALARTADWYAIKESLEFHLMGRALALLADGQRKPREAARALDELLGVEVRSALGRALPAAEPVPGVA